ncbi:sodium:alanine symporter family protein [uncultured Ilyobacter sp.]|jgi:AGCS family alanine or glycine:cation symporter|uniref:alanine/glycine:cation symporter family protein n=1 Tax=uncultured Ilyobacter sp. TaxID=544433 RepID=UPI002AA688D0|nr:sodium:alanine symporter family protein [uncultured Ilyobacter sp.]
MKEILGQLDSIIWGFPTLFVLVGTGIYLTINLKGIQVSKLVTAFKFLFEKDSNSDSKEGDVSGFAALCTALAATIGTGNIVGVATAIKLGGPGAIFWMWIAAFFGMSTKFAEGFLAIKYREKKDGEYSGGPMYYIEKGAKNKFLGKVFAFSGIMVALLGIGTFPQVNAVVEGVKGAVGIPTIATGIVLTVAVALVTFGGIKRISQVASFLVPFMAVFYIVGGVVIMASNPSATMSAVSLIISSAFKGSAAIGGFAGAGIMMAMRAGVARGVFSNEAGLGSAPIAAASAKTDSPVKQGLISMIGPFLDTLIVCSITGIIVVSSGLWSQDGLAGSLLTSKAFEFYLGSYGSLIVNVGIIFFAFTTIIGWNFYGEKCTQYLFQKDAIKWFKVIFLVMVASGPFLKLETIWLIADIVNGVMVIPNLVGLLVLRKVIIGETLEFFANPVFKKA